MCDYSLDLVASRPAKVGDELITTKFKNSITRGFAAIGEPNVAVCLLPGTEVAFEKEVKYERTFSLFPNMKLGGNSEQPDYLTSKSRFCPSAAFIGRGEAGNCSTVACWPSRSRVSSTVSPSGNCSAS